MEIYNTETSEINFHFRYPDPNNPMFSELKSIAGLGLETAKTEHENVNEIIGYSHSLFTHNGNNNPSAGDPLTILEEGKTGRSFRCAEYSTLAAGLLWAYGIPARTIGLKTRDVETRDYGAGHVVIEYWSSQFQKWIMSDVQAGIIPECNDALLSAHELNQRLGNNGQVAYNTVTGSRYSGIGVFGDKENYTDWIREYLYFIDTPVNLTLGNEDKSKQQIAMLVPLGIDPPKTFQGMFEMNAVYTHSILDFYPNFTG